VRPLGSFALGTQRSMVLTSILYSLHGMVSVTVRIDGEVLDVYLVAG
jgi:hypothetical protein